MHKTRKTSSLNFVFSYVPSNLFSNLWHLNDLLPDDPKGIHQVWASTLKNLKLAHLKSLTKYSKHWIDDQFQVGDLVFYKAHSVSSELDQKLAKLSYCPYHIQRFLSLVAASLADPSSRIYIKRARVSHLKRLALTLPVIPPLWCSPLSNITFCAPCHVKVTEVSLQAVPKEGWAYRKRSTTTHNCSAVRNTCVASLASSMDKVQYNVQSLRNASMSANVRLQAELLQQHHNLTCTDTTQFIIDNMGTVVYCPPAGWLSSAPLCTIPVYSAWLAFAWPRRTIFKWIVVTFTGLRNWVIITVGYNKQDPWWTILFPNIAHLHQDPVRSATDVKIFCMPLHHFYLHRPPINKHSPSARHSSCGSHLKCADAAFSYFTSADCFLVNHISIALSRRGWRLCSLE
ncbi:hypothetical protein PR048_011765, partial [Dryococelus australis]